MLRNLLKTTVSNLRQRHTRQFMDEANQAIREEPISDTDTRRYNDKQTFNNADLMGYVDKAPETEGKLMTFVLGTNYNRIYPDGKQTISIDRHTITVTSPWLQENVVAGMKKGDTVYVRGPIENRWIPDENDNSRYLKLSSIIAHKVYNITGIDKKRFEDKLEDDEVVDTK